MVRHFASANVPHQGVPETYFVNAKAELQGVIVGPTTEPVLQQRIDALLQE